MPLARLDAPAFLDIQAPQPVRPLPRTQSSLDLKGVKRGLDRGAEHKGSDRGTFAGAGTGAGLSASVHGREGPGRLSPPPPPPAVPAAALAARRATSALEYVVEGGVDEEDEDGDNETPAGLRGEARGAASAAATGARLRAVDTPRRAAGPRITGTPLDAAVAAPQPSASFSMVAGTSPFALSYAIGAAPPPASAAALGRRAIPRPQVRPM